MMIYQKKLEILICKGVQGAYFEWSYASVASKKAELEPSEVKKREKQCILEAITNFLYQAKALD